MPFLQVRYFEVDIQLVARARVAQTRGQDACALRSKESCCGVTSFFWSQHATVRGVIMLFFVKFFLLRCVARDHSGQ